MRSLIGRKEIVWQQSELCVFRWRGFGCASGFKILYTDTYASQWAPNGETTWHGYPIQMIADPYPVLSGDADGNGIVNANDALMVLRYALGIIDSIDFAAADVDGNGIVNANDALMILRAALGIITL